MDVNDVDESAIMTIDNVDVLDTAVNETADLEYEMEMYCQVDDAGAKMQQAAFLKLINYYFPF